MFRAVLAGESFEAVANQAGITRTAVERRVKRVALHLIQAGGVPGLHPDAAVQVGRLRERREDLLAALGAATLAPSAASRAGRVLDPSEVALGAHRLRAYAGHGQHDLALYHLIFATGLRPLEVARLQVADYLTEEGQVRRTSVLRAEAAINGRARPLHFRHRRLDESMSVYLAMRHAAGHERGQTLGWRGLDPASPLFLTCDGQPYQILSNGEAGMDRLVCRALLDVYRRIFRHSGIPGMCGQSARLTLMARMYERGADEDQVGLVLGIADRSGVREQLPRPVRPLERLLDEQG